MKRNTIGVLVCSLLFVSVIIGCILYDRLVTYPKAFCKHNLVGVAIILKIYANESKGEVFPEMDPRPGHLSPLYSEVHPILLRDYWKGPHPTHPNALPGRTISFEDASAILIDDQRYWYLGHLIWNDETGGDFIKAYQQAAKNGTSFAVTFNKGEDNVVHRLYEGAERHSISHDSMSCGNAAQSYFPTLIERPGNHNGGSHVLFMDGHVEFIPYPGKFPMTEEFVEGLRSLDALEQ